MSQEPFVIRYRAVVTGDRPRPYLVMHVTGVNGKDGRVIGLADSGADITSMPFPYATLMGYSLDTLQEMTTVHAAGTATSYRAIQSSEMYVPEMPSVIVTFTPVFVHGAETVLWGRCDFMAAFDVMFRESEQKFTIQTHSP